jgi:hypothetical protein
MDRVDLQQAEHRIRVDYIEWPALKLTARQARRLWSLSQEVCEAVLADLVGVGFLSHIDGLFFRRGLGRHNPGQSSTNHSERPGPTGGENWPDTRPQTDPPPATQPGVPVPSSADPDVTIFGAPLEGIRASLATPTP